jgi:hypothetical protein
MGLGHFGAIRTTSIPASPAYMTPHSAGIHQLAYTDRIKRDLLADFEGDSKNFELDHIIPQATGAHPLDQHNVAQSDSWVVGTQSAPVPSV